MYAKADNSNPGAGVDWSTYGKPKTPHEEDDERRFKEASGYGVPGSVLTRPGMSKSAAVAFLDTTESDAFKKRLQNDLDSIGSRTAPTASTTEIGPAGRMSAGKLGPAAGYGGASLDLKDDAAVRAQQAAMAARLRAIASGAAPSAGVEALRSNLDGSLAALTSAAGSARGKQNAGLAARALGQRSAQASQTTASDAAIMGAQDQQAAQAALANLQTSMRASDFAGADANAAMTQNAMLFSSDARNKFGLARAGMDQDASMFNASVGQEQADMNQQVQLANLEAQLRSQGLDDRAIAMRLGMMQDQMNKDKQDAMGFWGYAAGVRNFDSSMDYARDAASAQASAQRYAAGGSAVGSLAGAYGASQAQQEEEDRDLMRKTSDARAKTSVRDGAPALRAWLDQLAKGGF
jgi:hypothetical protein